MSPIQKYLKYGKIPFELTIHIIVVALAMSYVIFHNLEFSAFVNANERSMRTA